MKERSSIGTTGTMALRLSTLRIIMLGFVLISVFAIRPLQGAVRKVRITDKLDDVIDDEEDEDWKAWGTPKPKPRPTFDPPPDFVDGVDLSSYRNEMMKRSMGPTMGFVKLRLGVHREPEEVPQIAKKWTDLLKTGTIDAKMVAVDRSTLMITLPDGEDILEVKDFVLSQSEAYEFKVGQDTFRRPGDPPLEVVVQSLNKEREQQSKPPIKTVKEEL